MSAGEDDVTKRAGPGVAVPPPRVALFRSCIVRPSLEFNGALALREAIITLLFPLSIPIAYYFNSWPGVVAREFVGGSKGPFLKRNFVVGGQSFIAACTSIILWGAWAHWSTLANDLVLGDLTCLALVLVLRALMISTKWGYLGSRTVDAALSSDLSYAQRRMFEVIPGWSPLPVHLALKELFQTYRRLGLDPATPLYFRATSTASVKAALHDACTVLPDLGDEIKPCRFGAVASAILSSIRAGKHSAVDAERGAETSGAGDAPAGTGDAAPAPGTLARPRLSKRWASKAIVTEAAGAHGADDAMGERTRSALAEARGTVACPSVLYVLQLALCSSQDVQRALRVRATVLVEKQNAKIAIRLGLSTLQAVLPLCIRVLTGRPALGSHPASVACVLAAIGVQLAVGYNFVMAFMLGIDVDLRRRLFWQRLLGLLLHTPVAKTGSLYRLARAVQDELSRTNEEAADSGNGAGAGDCAGLARNIAMRATAGTAPVRPAAGDGRDGAGSGDDAEDAGAARTDAGEPRGLPADSTAPDEGKGAAGASLQQEVVGEDSAGACDGADIEAGPPDAEPRLASAPSAESGASVPSDPAPSRSRIVLAPPSFRNRNPRVASGTMLSRVFGTGETAKAYDDVHIRARMEGSMRDLACGVAWARGVHELRLDATRPESVAAFTEVHDVLLAFGIMYHLRMRIFVAYLLLVSAVVTAWLVASTLGVAPSGSASAAATGASNVTGLDAETAVYLSVGLFLSLVGASTVFVFAKTAQAIARAASQHAESLSSVKMHLSRGSGDGRHCSGRAASVAHVVEGIKTHQMLTDAITRIERSMRKAPVLAAGRGSAMLLTKGAGAIVAASLAAVMRKVIVG